MVQTQGLVGASGGASLAGALACGLVFYCLHLVWTGEARARHKVFLAISCFFLPKTPVLLARLGGPGEGVDYSGMVRLVMEIDVIEAGVVMIGRPSKSEFFCTVRIHLDKI